MRAAIFHLRIRRVTFVAVLATAILVGAASSLTVPSLQGDPGIPRTRVSLLLAGTCAGIQVLFVRGIVADRERLAVVSMRAARCAVFLLTQVICFALALLAGAVVHGQAAALSWRTATVTLALAAVAMLAGRINTFAGLVAPWAYLAFGLALGYQTTIGGKASARPWAWLVDDSAPLGITLIAAVVVTVAAAMVDPLRQGNPDDL